MALIKCTECGKEISDKAEACPNCGCPVDEMDLPKNQMEELNINTDYDQESEKPKRRILKVVAVAAIVIIAAGIGIFLATSSSRKYSSALKLYNNKEYEEAQKSFDKLGDYKDSKSYLEKCNYNLTVDGQFINALEDGISKRWDESDKNEAAGKGYEDPVIYSSYCDIELSEVEKYYDMDFDNKDLQEDARKYIDLLGKAKDCTKYYTVDYSNFYDTWHETYLQRTMLLKKFVDNYDLVLDEKYQETLDKLMIDASAAAEQEKIKTDIQKMADSFKLVESEDEWGYKSYKLQMKNTTDYVFDYFSVEISIEDSNGKIIGDGSASEVSSWQPGQEAEIDAYVDRDIDINQVSIKYIPHYHTGNIYE